MANLSLEELTPVSEPPEVTGAYVSDLLSDVLGHAKAGTVWITIQTHQNVVAVASLLNLAGVIFAGGQRPEPQVIAKASAENVPLLLAKESSYTLAGLLYQMGVR